MDVFRMLSPQLIPKSIPGKRSCDFVSWEQHSEGCPLLPWDVAVPPPREMAVVLQLRVFSPPETLRNTVLLGRTSPELLPPHLP